MEIPSKNSIVSQDTISSNETDIRAPKYINWIYNLDRWGVEVRGIEE